MLEIRGLEVSYGPVEAVRGIDLDVKMRRGRRDDRPERCGQDVDAARDLRAGPVHEGTITFDGNDCRKANIEELARLGLIHVPEGRHVFPSLNVHENLQVGTTAGTGRSEGFSIDDVYDLFPPLQPLRKRDGWALSGGEQQMVAIGRALVAKPRMLLLDEPSLGLSPKFTQAVYGALAQVSDRIPMLLVEQNTVMALRHCTRAAVMVGGKLVLEGTAEELGDREALVASYLGEEPALAGEEVAASRRESKRTCGQGGDPQTGVPSAKKYHITRRGRTREINRGVNCLEETQDRCRRRCGRCHVAAAAIVSGPAGAQAGTGKKTLYCIGGFETKGESALAIPNFDDGAKLAVKDLQKKGWTSTTSASRRRGSIAASQEAAFLAGAAEEPRRLDRPARRATCSSRWARRSRPRTSRRSRSSSPSEGVKTGPSGGDNIFLLRPLNEQTYAESWSSSARPAKQLKLKDVKIGLNLVNTVVRPDGRADREA